MSEHLQEEDGRWMALAVQEARKGRPSPNPHVGAAIVSEGRLVAVGHHAKAGEAHAEVDAIRAANSDLQGMTLYVTMEPCNHHGRTPPCTKAILDAGFSRVVIGYRDPAPHVPGAMELLASSGVNVTSGVLEPECRELIADFEKHIKTGIPYVVLKAAVTLDGKMASRTGDSKWITGEQARTRAHQLRTEVDAVAVGVETVIADDPRLDVRHVEGQSPRAVVFDTHLRTPTSAQLLSRNPWVFHGAGASAEAQQALRDAGAELVEVPVVDGRVDLHAALLELGRRDIVRIMVEGGGVLHGALLDAGLADRANVFVAPRILGDVAARTFAAGRGFDSVSQAFRLRDIVVTQLGDDVLIDGALIREEG